MSRFNLLISMVILSVLSHNLYAVAIKPSTYSTLFEKTYTLLDNGKPYSLTPSPKPFVLIFWASWCVSCREEIKHLNSKLKGDAKSRMLTVSVDEGKGVKKAKSFLKSYKISIPSILDKDKDFRNIFKVSQVPLSIVISVKDKQWQQNKLISGALSAQQVLDLLKP